MAFLYSPGGVASQMNYRSKWSRRLLRCPTPSGEPTVSRRRRAGKQSNGVVDPGMVVHISGGSRGGKDGARTPVQCPKIPYLGFNMLQNALFEALYFNFRSLKVYFNFENFHPFEVVSR